ncbi:MAG: hypothetical protein WB621_11835 [Candidatus Acidiferrales bacterium]
MVSSRVLRIGIDLGAAKWRRAMVRAVQTGFAEDITFAGFRQRENLASRTGAGALQQRLNGEA